jgi:Protein of unknown function (DUF3237)
VNSQPLAQFEFEMTYAVRTTNPLDPTDESPYGAKQYWQVSEALLEGPRIHATLAATGIDWMGVGADGFWRPNVHAQFLTDDGQVVLMHYTGLVRADDPLQRSGGSGRAHRLAGSVHAIVD